MLYFEIEIVASMIDLLGAKSTILVTPYANGVSKRISYTKITVKLRFSFHILD